MMISISSAILPILLVVFFGAILRRRKILSEKTVGDLKYLLIKNILPVAIFNALATATYSSESWIIVGLMLAILAVSFTVGYLIRPLLPDPFRKYLPFLVTAYEGGMIAFPLYTQLCGSEALYHIAILEIAACMFGYAVYMNFLSFTESGEKPKIGRVVQNAFANPAFIAVIIGLAVGTSGILSGFLASEYARIYHAVVNTITMPLTPMILLVVGYSIDFKREYIVPSLKTIALRAALQTALIAIAVLFLHRLTTPNRLQDMAFLIYMSAPPTFSLQSFIKDPQGANYASTVSTLYIFISLAVYAGVSLLM